MYYKKFTILDYKGIKSLVLDLSLKPDYKIYTLVGLNESGKTTILEAINDFEFEVPEDKKHLLIPKSAAGGFTGRVSIKAVIGITSEDKKKITDFLSKKIKFKDVIIKDEFTLERVYSFTNSVPEVTPKRTYSPFISVKNTSRSKESELVDQQESELWSYIKEELFPEIIFYRDFLSKFPEKIWLTPGEGYKEEYFSIIEDVLTSINPTYNVQGSILDRLSSPTNANTQALEAVENQVGAKISKVVFDAWNRIQKVSKKEIVAKTGHEGERYYIRLNVKEGQQTYSVAERSLGFRWFFTFLLYTEFRKERIETSGEILFLLDEPASNLHQAAQQSLLDTFEKISNKARLVYTTHSHHLVNPMWLNSAYIVKNKGLEYKENDDFDSSKTEVEAYTYRKFVSQYPTETSYFQPILDVLDYKPGMLEHVPNVVITEGKFDYFVFKYFKDVVFQKEANNFCVYPGQGATALDLPIALYEAWGRGYMVLLDSDKEGRSQKIRYIKELSDADRIKTLEDIDPSFKNISTEDLFSAAEKVAITNEFNPSLSSYNKGAFHTGIQTLYHEKRIPDYLEDETRKKFAKIFDYLRKGLSV